MTDLDRALADIADMKSVMSRSVLFRGYGPQALAVTGLLAAGAAIAQRMLVPDPAGHLTEYLTLWAATAALAIAVIGWEAIRRARQAHGGLADEMLMAAVVQFAPAGVAGILLTLVITRFLPQAVPMLPGLWQLVLSLGVAAACTSLPRQIVLVAVWYMISGLLCLILAQGDLALSPFAMGIPFLAGQLLASGLFHLSYQEGSHDQD